jgi:hypothetical protein
MESFRLKSYSFYFFRPAKRWKFVKCGPPWKYVKNNWWRRTRSVFVIFVEDTLTLPNWTDTCSKMFKAYFLFMHGLFKIYHANMHWISSENIQSHSSLHCQVTMAGDQGFHRIFTIDFCGLGAKCTTGITGQRFTLKKSAPRDTTIAYKL